MPDSKEDLGTDLYNDEWIEICPRGGSGTEENNGRLAPHISPRPKAAAGSRTTWQWQQSSMGDVIHRGEAGNGEGVVQDSKELWHSFPIMHLDTCHVLAYQPFCKPSSTRRESARELSAHSSQPGDAALPKDCIRCCWAVAV